MANLKTFLRNRPIRSREPCMCLGCTSMFNDQIGYWAAGVVESNVKLTPAFMRKLGQKHREALVKEICLKAAKR